VYVYTFRSACIHTQECLYLHSKVTSMFFLNTLCTLRSVCIHTQECMYTHTGVSVYTQEWHLSFVYTLCTLRSVCHHTFTLRSGRLIEPSSRVLSLIKGSLTSSDDLLQWLGAFWVPTPVCVFVCVCARVCVRVCECVYVCVCPSPVCFVAIDVWLREL
jgi:hypothetical protein